jgi:hypothetical protein
MSMDSIFLSPEATFDISVKTEFSETEGVKIAVFKITDGGPFQVRTATGREYARVQNAYRRRDPDELYDLLKLFVVKGVPADKIGLLHPDLAWTILFEVLKRSRLSETDQGK